MSYYEKAFARQAGVKSEVNIVYHLPGSLLKPDYIGLRTGRFSEKEKALMIQVSVEEEWISQENYRIVLNYIIDTADEAIGMAKGKFDTAGIEYDLEGD